MIILKSAKNVSILAVLTRVGIGFSGIKNEGLIYNH